MMRNLFLTIIILCTASAQVAAAKPCGWNVKPFKGCVAEDLKECDALCNVHPSADGACLCSYREVSGWVKGHPWWPDHSVKNFIKRMDKGYPKS
jgi:hypothetical protein